MSETLLTREEHRDLLEKLNRLPLEESAVYRQKLEELFAKYDEQIVGLFATISAYEKIADWVKLRTK